MFNKYPVHVMKICELAIKVDQVDQNFMNYFNEIMKWIFISSTLLIKGKNKD